MSKTFYQSVFDLSTALENLKRAVIESIADALQFEKILNKIESLFPSLKTEEQEINYSEWVTIRGVQCGKSAYHEAVFKKWLSDEKYQRPYRHMWE